MTLIYRFTNYKMNELKRVERDWQRVHRSSMAHANAEERIPTSENVSSSASNTQHNNNGANTNDNANANGLGSSSSP
jgi:hypothetical protein